MDICSLNHCEICFVEDECPMCLTLDEMEVLKDEIEDLNEEIRQLEEKP